MRSSPTAKSKAGNLLKGAEPYTEVFAKGDKRYFRARFAGLKEERGGAGLQGIAEEQDGLFRDQELKLGCAVALC